MSVARSNRRGFTLRELTIAIAIGGSVMGVAVGLVHHAFDWSKTARHRRMDDQTFFNLSRQLRSDVHLARTATITSRETSNEAIDHALDLVIGNGNDVVYTVAENSVIRIETRNDVPIRRESYQFKHPRSISLDQAESANQIQLNIKSVTPFQESEVPLWRSLRISIGLRLRHQNGDIES
ncbi:MAG: prepilin-type N-terminal cleavage/methylation domain-containing protein [Planctomycetales bacterium]|nr:prepilin-type N-terminal cleavage/methylation domain-containing protein [Planctomycetales bacterium]